MSTAPKAPFGSPIADRIGARSPKDRSRRFNRRAGVARLAALLAERVDTRTRAAEDQRWRQHTQLERGNAVRVYRGADWTREQ